MTEEVNNKVCGCTGIRNCLLCRDDEVHNNTRNDSLVFWFCPACRLVYEGDISWSLEKGTVSWCMYHQDVPSNEIINGIDVYEEFINKEEEAYLFDEISADLWKLSQSGRRKQDFGPKANFKKKKLKLGTYTGLPAYSEFLVNRMNTSKVLETFEPVELCNLEYTPERGSSIDPHIDDMWLWGEQLVTVNLQSRTLLTLYKPKMVEDSCDLKVSKETNNNIEVQIPMSRRSLVILENEARKLWTHGIKPCHIINQRLAMTFRDLSVQFENDTQYLQVKDKIKRIALTFTGKVIA